MGNYINGNLTRPPNVDNYPILNSFYILQSPTICTGYKGLK